MDYLVACIEYELHIIDKAKQETACLGMQVTTLFPYDSCAWFLLQHLLQSYKCFVRRYGKRKWRDPLSAVICLAGHAIGACRARWKFCC